MPPDQPALTQRHEQFAGRVFHLMTPLMGLCGVLNIPAQRRVANEARNALAHVIWAHDAHSSIDAQMLQWNRAIAHLDRAGLDLLKIIVRRLQSYSRRLDVSVMSHITEMRKLGAAGNEQSLHEKETAADGMTSPTPGHFGKWWKIVHHLLYESDMMNGINKAGLDNVVAVVQDGLDCLIVPPKDAPLLTISAPQKDVLNQLREVRSLEFQLQACAGKATSESLTGWLDHLFTVANSMANPHLTDEDWLSQTQKIITGIRDLLTDWYLYNIDQEITDQKAVVPFLEEVRQKTQGLHHNPNRNYPDQKTIERLQSILTTHLEQKGGKSRSAHDINPPWWYRRSGMIIMLDICGSTNKSPDGDNLALLMANVYQDIRSQLDAFPIPCTVTVNTWGDAILLVFNSTGITAQKERQSLDSAEDTRIKYSEMGGVLKNILPRIAKVLGAHGIAARGGVATGDYNELYNSLRDTLDVTGPAIFLAARLEPIAINGEILIYPHIVYDVPNSKESERKTDASWLTLSKDDYDFEHCDRKVVKSITAGVHKFDSGNGIEVVRWRIPVST